jgi:hypothetical protein
MNKRIKWFVAGTLLVVLCFFAFHEAIFPESVPPEFHERIVAALANTESIALSYCELVDDAASGKRVVRVSDKDLVTLSPVERDKLAALLRRRWFLGHNAMYPRCWEPHHVIRFVQKDDKKLDVYVCFTCWKYEPEGLPFRAMPKRLMERLKPMFISKGLDKHTND